MRQFIERYALILSVTLGLGVAAWAQGFVIPNNSIVQGHLGIAGSPPVLSACGTTPALAAGSTDSRGTVTMGTTATGCVITFAVAYGAAPTCVVTWRATPLASQSYTISTTALTLTQTSTSNNLIDYSCSGA